VNRRNHVNHQIFERMLRSWNTLKTQKPPGARLLECRFLFSFIQKKKQKAIFLFLWVIGGG
jgi:hypothetical protein